ncbi:hypothetical protein PHLGIDRAFT_35738 [Phlebiopsis gigantea 11061_1 CR5-6]|uniref:Myb-like domain-containing protein n=1 Tax=Phlebiopsis gigantea (strain 11061_1 CR5-6) TaxID=745531 RepID=A0A0C3RY26_PHLG1|nr:hypothetical protein PHLGIDRAFT_35738 [Phlebiopsis gigantea 11061_1 CR5-6]
MSSATPVPVPGPSTISTHAQRPAVSPVVLPGSSSFSFTAPYPASVSQPSKLSSTSLSTPTSPYSLKQQRRVSLALPGSPRPYTTWPFRDDTKLKTGNSTGEPLAALAARGRIMDDVALHLAGTSASTAFTFTPSSLSTPHNFVSPLTLNSGAPTEASGGSAPTKSSKLPPTSGGDPPKKTRKKWSMDETQMLVNGCNKWGVGNWKAILNDPELKFDNRSPVDLKDRFRTYFPDAYKHHYPNARTHLPSASSTVARASTTAKSRSLLPDGSPLFLSSRQKKRRPFTAEEDRALKEGYDKHGTVWATIVKDPVFKEQGRRSTDLRDRFRNAWPELYAKAGYKPRANAAKKIKVDRDSPEDQSPPGIQDTAITSDATPPASEPHSAPAAGSLATWGGVERTRGQPVRAATDDQLPTAGTSSSIGPVRRKRRHTTQGFGLYRGGTKSVPESSVNTEDETSDDEEHDLDGVELCGPTRAQLSQVVGARAKALGSTDVDMDVSTLDLGPDFISSSSLSMSDMTDSSSQAHTSWSELDTPLDAWSSAMTSNPQLAAQNQGQTTLPNSGPSYNASAAASPTPTDYLLPNSPNGRVLNGGMIGKSAWGPQDWLSANPRLDDSGGSFVGGMFTPSPVGSPSLYASAGSSNPVSFAQLSFSHLALASSSGSQGNQFSHAHSSHVQSQAYSQGVMDRYDLFPSALHHSGNDEFDIDTLDLDFISEGFDASSDVHSAFSDPSSAWATGGIGSRRGGFTHHSNYAGDLIFGARTHQPTRQLSSSEYGLGFGFGTFGSNAGMGLGLEGSQSVLHTPALPGIDEIELTGISLNDPPQNEKNDVAMAIEEAMSSPTAETESQDQFQPLSLDDIVGIPPGPEAQDEIQGGVSAEENDTSHHITPPATPANAFRASARGQGSYSSQHRSVSVPPTEHRAFMPPPRPGQSQMTSPKAKYKSMMTPTRSTFAVPQLPPSISARVSNPIVPVPPISQVPLQPPSHILPTANTLWPPFDSENHGLPFLDLHYYTPNDFLQQSFPTESIQLGAQALDLAHAPQSPHTHFNSAQKPLCVPPFLLQTMLSPQAQTQDVKLSKSPAHHQRGQSAVVVSPQDLLIRRGNDNKRKRASWDGGPK